MTCTRSRHYGYGRLETTYQMPSKIAMVILSCLPKEEEVLWRSSHESASAGGRAASSFSFGQEAARYPYPYPIYFISV
jgi:hypothetical protein